MPKVMKPRGTPALDMTPMVDLAFLLVTFFMLTASFRAKEAVVVDPPTSQTDSLIPKMAFVMTLGKENQLHIDINHAPLKAKAVKNLIEEDKVDLTNEEVEKFVKLDGWAVPLEKLRSYIEMEPSEREKSGVIGVPFDTAKATVRNCDLFKWVAAALIEEYAYKKELISDAASRKAGTPENPFLREKLRFVIKADGKAKYNDIRKLMFVLKEAGVPSFEMITGLEDKVKIGGSK